ncbi:MAG: hypothetical protein AAGG38_01905 [Planctomycetota bacterium]
MNYVDFLPQSYREQRRKSLRILREFIVVGSVLGGLLLLTLMVKTHSHSQKQTAERLESTLTAEQATLNIYEDIRQQRLRLLEHFEIKKTLTPSITYSQVLSVLGAAIPEEITVTTLTMRSVRPTPDKIEDTKNQKRQKRETVEVPSRNYIVIEFEALAPDDMVIAELISAIDQHPLFSKVGMQSSREIETRGVVARRFNLAAEIDVNREFHWVAPDQEVAHVD